MLTDYTFLDSGFTSRPQFFVPAQCQRLLDRALSDRDYRSIFLSEMSYFSDPQRRGNNPRPGRNLLARLETEFIFGSPAFRNEMTRVCGPRWRVLDYKLVMGYPDAWLPEWLQAELGDRPVANLGEYVKPQFRDITYFRGIDWHQDIIDWPDRPADFVTAYIYLGDVGPNDSPLHAMPLSHELGATTFPHRLTRCSTGYCYESDDGDGRGMIGLDAVCLTGQGGDMFYWHPFCLHGTMPQANSEPRISVRILVEKNARADNGCELDRVNARIQGAASLAVTQDDIDASGKVVRTGNIINGMVS